MIECIDYFLNRKYDRKHYNCLHFTRDVWFAHTGVDITEALVGVFDPSTRSENLKKTLRRFHRIESSVDPCIVMMHRQRVAPHIGVFIRGKVLHLNETGVEYLPVELASRGFSSVRYYLCN